MAHKGLYMILYAVSYVIDNNSLSNIRSGRYENSFSFIWTLIVYIMECVLLERKREKSGAGPELTNSFGLRLSYGMIGTRHSTQTIVSPWMIFRTFVIVSVHSGESCHGPCESKHSNNNNKKRHHSNRYTYIYTRNNNNKRKYNTSKKELYTQPRSVGERNPVVLNTTQI